MSAIITQAAIQCATCPLGCGAIKLEGPPPAFPQVAGLLILVGHRIRTWNHRILRLTDRDLARV